MATKKPNPFAKTAEPKAVKGKKPAKGGIAPFAAGKKGAMPFGKGDPNGKKCY